MQSLLIALGGHIDHGKTSFIKALNGFDGDSTAEEKERNITMDLSFSNLVIGKGDNQKNIAFIDVPGHEKLVKRMIAGLSALDMLCILIASNEGIKPQTIEHLHIAKGLDVERIICILSKVDLVDEAMILRRKTEIKELFAILKLELLHIFPFSTKVGEVNPYTQKIINFFLHYSFSADKDNADSITNTSSECEKLPIFYIDRSFTLNGIGALCTGTLAQGSLKVGQKVQVCELGKEYTIKSMQVHNTSVEEVSALNRLALHLSNINHNELKRGNLITLKGYLRGSHFIDAKITTFAQYRFSTQGNYTMHIGTQTYPIKLSELEDDFYTIRSAVLIFSRFYQRFIIHDGLNSVAYGIVLNPISDPIKRKDRITLLKALDSKDFVSAFKLLVHVHKRGFGIISSIQRFGMSHKRASEVMDEIDGIYFDKKELVAYDLGELEGLKTQIQEIFLKNKFALISVNLLNIRYKWASAEFLQMALDELVSEKMICKEGNLYINNKSNINEVKAFIKQQIYDTFTKQNYEPDAPYNIYEALDIDRREGDRALKELTKAKKVVRLNHNLFIESRALIEINNLMREIIRTQGYIDISNFKATLSLSRKYLINYLEYLDCFSDIIREGDRRVMKFQVNK